MSESHKFINTEKISAKLLFGMTLLALCLSNSPLNSYYHNLFHAYIVGHLATISFKFNLLFWINDGLMTIFFLIVGLEIKYEITKGTLNSLRKAALPTIAAMGGMVVPALIYIGFNHHDATYLRGWAIPTATDIAFAISILSLLGKRVRPALKVFLTALAILDDLAAIIIIAIFYTEQISFVFLSLAALSAMILFILNRLHVVRLSAYILIGFALWVFLEKSGIHATLAGVLLAFMIPLQSKKQPQYSPLKKLQHTLHPWVAFIILPLFAFANAGVSFLHLGTQKLHISPILGVLFGLFVGKQLGIFSASWLAVKLRIATLPPQVRWSELYATAIICGIGFTISFFIGSLAFGYEDSAYLNSTKIGILTGSLLSGCVGYLLLLFIYKKHNKNILSSKKIESIKRK